MALLEDAPDLDLYDRDWLIHTQVRGAGAGEDRADGAGPSEPISHGCVINGHGRQLGAVAGRARRRRRRGPRLDRDVRHRHPDGRRRGPRDPRQGGRSSGPGAIIGDGPDLDTPNEQEPGRLNTGITVVGKRAVVPRGTRIGRNVRVDGDVRVADFPADVRSGSTVERRALRTPRHPRSWRPAAEQARPRSGTAESGHRSRLPTGRVSRGPRRAATARPGIVRIRAAGTPEITAGPIPCHG